MIAPTAVGGREPGAIRGSALSTTPPGPTRQPPVLRPRLQGPEARTALGQDCYYRWYFYYLYFEAAHGVPPQSAVS